MEEIRVTSIREYQKWAEDTWSGEERKLRTILGLVGEAGEVAEKVKKYYRGDYNEVELVKYLTKELGDVLYYLVICCKEFDINIEDVMSANINKLQKRKKNNTIKGSGDDR